MKTTFALVLTLCWLTPCFSADSASTPAPAPQPKAATAKKSVSKPAPSKLPGPQRITPATAKTTSTTTKTAKTTAKPTPSRNAIRTEAEVSGFSSETSDSFHSRLNLTKAAIKHKWWIRTDYGFTRSRSFGKKKISESQVAGYNLDAMYRRNAKSHYKFISLILGNRTRSPHTSSQYDSSDFSILSAGYGKAILPGLEFETSLAQISRDKGDTDAQDRVSPMYTIRIKKPINPAVIMDADVHLVEPWTDNSLVDSRMNLTYKLTPALSMRFTYVANNVLGTTLTKREWDKSFRVSLVFAR